MKNLPFVVVGAAVALILGVVWALSAHRPSAPDTGPSLSASRSNPSGAPTQGGKVELDPSTGAATQRAVPESNSKLAQLDAAASKPAVPLGDAASGGATDPLAPDARVAPTDSEADNPTKATFLAKYEGYQPAELRQAYEDLQRWLESNTNRGTSQPKLDPVQVEKIAAEVAWLKERINN